MCGEENTSQAASVEFVCRRRTNYARSRLQPLCQKGILFDSDNPAGSCPRSVGSACPKASQSFAAAAAKESQIIFFGDMCGEENTSQAASVEFVRWRRTNYARSRLQPLCQKVILFDSDNPAGLACGVASAWPRFIASEAGLAPSVPPAALSHVFAAADVPETATTPQAIACGVASL